MQRRARGPSATADEAPWSATQVVKTMWPPQPGTQRWRRQYGADLVCVRYRYSSNARHRYTTIELLVDHDPLQHRRAKRPSYELSLTPGEGDLARKLREAGAQWDADAERWRLSAKLVRQLKLTTRAQKRTPE